MGEQSDADRLVTVCSECLMATCWHGIFLCDRSRSANIVKKPIRDLRALNREHESYWSKEHLEQYGDYNG